MKIEASTHTTAVRSASCRELPRNSRKRSVFGVPLGPVISWNAHDTSWRVGARNARSSTMPQTAKAVHARTPSRRRGPSPAAAPAASPKRARPRMMRSSPMIISATTNTRVANSDAASRSKVPRQMRKTPTVTVSTPKYWTVAKSVIVSIITTATPAASAGRSIGITTRRAASSGPAPRLLATL